MHGSCQTRRECRPYTAKLGHRSIHPRVRAKRSRSVAVWGSPARNAGREAQEWAIGANGWVGVAAVSALPDDVSRNSGVAVSRIRSAPSIASATRLNSQGNETWKLNSFNPIPQCMMGKPVVSGTRITVELILEKLSAGETVDQILEAHPRLTREGVLAALGFAARALRADVVYPTVGQST